MPKITPTAVKRVLGRGGRRPWGGVLILCYHRVVDLANDPQALAVSPKNFSAHLDFFAERLPPLALDEALAAVCAGRLPRRGVVITFDDGYADVFHEARPLLERKGMPATVFVSSGFVSSTREFFWDELDRLLLHPGRLPATLKLTIAEQPWEHALNGCAEYTAAQFEQHRGWAAGEGDDPTARHTAYRLLCRRLRPLPHGQRENVLDQLRAVGEGVRERSTHRVMNAEELRALAATPGMDIGSHTATHPELAALSEEQKAEEIARGRADLERLLGKYVRNFSYPFGGTTDYGPTAAMLARRAGFVSGSTLNGGLLQRDAKLMTLPRILVRNWDAPTLAAKVRRWVAC